MRIRELVSLVNQLDTICTEKDISLLNFSCILRDYKIGAVPVVDDNDDLIGVISERDIVRFIADNPEDFFSSTVAAAMTPDVITCHPDDLTDDVYKVLTSKKIRHMPVIEGGSLLAMLSIRDFEKAYEILRKQSLTDELTGVGNLRRFTSILDSEFNQYRRFHTAFSVAAITIDKFDELITRDGVTAGDKILRQIAEIISSETRAYDSIGRTSENRFAVLFPNTDQKTASRACDRILKAVQNASDEASGCTTSIGLAVAGADDRDGNSIIERSNHLSDEAAGRSGNSIEMDVVSDPISVDSLSEFTKQLH